jgi:hypothetical protein
LGTLKEDQQADRLEQNEANQEAQDAHIGEKDDAGLRNVKPADEKPKAASKKK